MSNHLNSDEEVLARLMRETGDPSVSPDPQYAETLRATILGRLGPAETVTHVTGGVRKADGIPITVERTRATKRITRLAMAATILIAVGILVLWMTIGGGSANIALAQVADALDRLRSATYEIKSEAKEDNGQPTVTTTGKGFFRAPSHQRIETTVDIAGGTTHVGGQPVTIPGHTTNHITIVDGQEAKSIMLMPTLKTAIVTDMQKMREDMEKSAEGAPPDMFEMVRRLVREGSSGTGEMAERLGKKEIDGREAVGFRTHSNGEEMTLWADPETARPVRIEVATDAMTNVRYVMNNFRYDVELDPALFSLEPPAGYSTQTIKMTMPVEEDLLNTLRIIAGGNEGLFPAELGMNGGSVLSMTVTVPKMKIGELTQDKLKAEMKKMMQEQLPVIQEQTQGIAFYEMLKPENDPHYVGGGVKLGTPDRPILWYKPTGADKYRVIYADLSVKDMAPDDVKKLPEAKAR